MDALKRGLVPPSEFVPALEATGLITRGRPPGILERAVRRLAALARRRPARAADRGQRGGRAAARRRLRAAACASALAAVDGNPAALSIEVTESILISNMERAIEVLAEVRALGHAGGDRRLRHRLFLARLPRHAAGRRGEDRPRLRQARSRTDPAYRGIVATCVHAGPQPAACSVVAEGVETRGAGRRRCASCAATRRRASCTAQPVPADELARMLGQSARAVLTQPRPGPTR